MYEKAAINHFNIEKMQRVLQHEEFLPKADFFL